MGALTNRIEQTCALLNARRIDEVLDQYDADCQIVMPTGHPLRPAEFAEFHRALTLAFPDLRWDVVRTIESGESVAAELRFTGTNTGPFHTGVNALPATGAHLTFHACEVIRFRGQKIAEWRSYFDQVAVLGQLGWL